MPKKEFNISAYTDWVDATVIETTNKIGKDFLYNLWDEVVPGNPVLTGLSRFSWRMTPDRKSTYKPNFESEVVFDENSSGRGGYTSQRIFPNPERPNLEKYKRIHSKFFLFNNQDYVMDLNDDDSKPYYQFVSDGINKAIIKSKQNAKS